jgi:hypothetical protein
MQEVDEMAGTGGNKKVNRQEAMTSKSRKRRDEWVDFHAKKMEECTTHEKKIKFNYFQDRTLTNPALHDFRPDS